MPLHGSYRRTLVDRVQAYAEGRTGDGSPLQGGVDERLVLVPQLENPSGDWIDDLAATGIPFMFDGRGSAFAEEDSGGTEIEELAVITRVALDEKGSYSYRGFSWTIESSGSTASASAEYAFTYVLQRHVE